MIEQLSVVNCQLSIDKAWGIVEVQSSKYKAYGYRFFPYKIKGEGFFIAAFKKNEGEESSYRSQQLTGISKQEANDLNDWIKERKNLFFFKQYENIIAIPLQWKQDLTLLQKNLYIKKAGVTIGSMKGKDFIPEHGLAVSLLLNEKIPFVSLNYE